VRPETARLAPPPDWPRPTGPAKGAGSLAGPTAIEPDPADWDCDVRTASGAVSGRDLLLAPPSESMTGIA